jgi:hypothetical protein
VNYVELEQTPKKREGKVIVQFTFKDFKEWSKHSDKLHHAAEDVKASISVREV